MGLDALGELALQVQFDVTGVPATITLPDSMVIQTSAIWLEQILVDVPVSGDFTRREARRVVALLKADVPSVPKDTRIDAAERDGGPVQAWRVDQPEGADPDHSRVIVVPW